MHFHSRLGVSPLDTVAHWSELAFDEDESIQVTRSLRTGRREARTHYTGDTVDLSAPVDVERDDDLLGEKWHVEARERPTGKGKGHFVSSKKRLF